MNSLCPECRKDVSCNIEEVMLRDTLKGEAYEYAGLKATCPDCESELYIAEIEDYNIKTLYDSDREKNSIISLEKIQELPNKYGIGKRPLSLLLGWGEMTFSRYYDGDMPTKQYSEIMQRIYDDPIYYRSLLEKNKNNLKSQAAFAKSKKVTSDLINNANDPKKKIDITIEYLLCKCEDITPLALQKILYYIQGFHYAFTNNYIFYEDCEAWAHGPVFRDIYQRYSSYRFDPIEGKTECDESLLKAYEKAIIDSIIKSLGCYSGKTLESFTHSEKPWLDARRDLPPKVHSYKVIPKQEIGNYFATVKELYGIINPPDIENYAKKMFEQLN